MSHPYFHNEPMVLAHRGASAYAPDHTLEALQLAVDQGADAIEIDVHASRDGVPVLHHGGDLSESTEAEGPVGAYTLDQLRQLDAGYRYTPDGGATFPHRGKGHTVVTLAEALDSFPHTRFNLDIKERRAARATRRVIDEFDAARRVLLAAFYSWQRSPALRDYPGPRSITQDQMIVFMLLHWTRLDALWPLRVDAFQLPEFHRGMRVVTPRLIERAHDLGVRVHIWTVDDRVDMRRLLDWGADGIITKKPDVAVATRARHQEP
ncbi:MAG: glycerophosphodiester phosphodiesterase [Gemmatimonadetes bacterium]|uniref:Glycerophosphodiester phosphodiesterase n=1 Tax=Candidatus Kutchimonas denitrificans TaxID=3056748 RepID=A0AAE4ZAU0_9BACT|nr:glycerophosphodiester phosphodiesterase [Gemmatimonadota bacterium]NIR74711.1 glycerophosphodiester phosphodiesterase [Candidatus Kutchimonas denitrificans]NIS01461.1 glycerophosphodiester phosphodiesterase [Gemmatimonadota bacterium]NIT67202.1 glycerophosphodiester phosphodiesterase [Gemmatimonadota bacterium]NIU52376.1 glycerophosphodiester phosphodiesterase [Gemmatimonadota bacterium]